MTRNEAVQKLATAGRLSIAHAEDLYDSFFPKPVVSQCVADWDEGHKDEFEINLYREVCRSEENYDYGSLTDFQKWLTDPKIQWMRITEEVGEIRDVLLKPTKFTEPQAALKDAIGDTLVTIIVLAHQLDLDVTECLGIAYEEIKNRKGKMINGTFVKEEDL